MKITYTELQKLAAKDRKRRKLKRLVAVLLIERAALKQQIQDLLAGDAALLAKATAAFEKAEMVEAKMRGGLPAQ